jgi:cyclopropane-fatty-acyl-phospholipid synthase
MVALPLAEGGFVPDWLVRRGIRRLLRHRLHEESSRRFVEADQGIEEFAEELRSSPIVIEADSANQQHYEVPAAFYERVLGPRLKYSCGYWPHGETKLAESEELMLDITCRRAELEDGMDVLDLGCGWGSLSLWIAEHFPECRVTAVSNSHSQRQFIEDRCRTLGLKNVEVRTCNISQLELDRRFDRVLSVEMFEHVRNYHLLLSKIRSWLTDDGKLFVHIFCHRNMAYAFDDRGASDWMSRHFFTGGIMPAEHLLAQFQDDMQLESQWRVSGLHYAQTCEAWLQNLDRHHDRVLETLEQSTPETRPQVQLQRWRMFFMACAELFRYHDGNEWFVGHYRFRRRAI